MKTNLTFNNLITKLDSEPAFRVKQVLLSFFSGNLSYQNVSTISKQMRKYLEEEIDVSTIKDFKVFPSKIDETYKALLLLHDDLNIETVLMKNLKGNWTVCVSSQAGCPVKCSFCATGKLGLERNLDSLEITEQVIFWQRFLKKQNSNKKRISNIVVMGMGEPLLNYDNVKRALNLILDYCDIGHNYITVSTVGIMSNMFKLLKDKEWPKVKIAISLHSVINKIRAGIVPIHFDNFFEDLKKWCVNYSKYSGSRTRPLTFEYVMLKGINDSKRDAVQLSLFLKNLKRVKVNLIPYNLVSDSGMRGTDEKSIAAFKKTIMDNKITVTVRKSVGQDIKAACGQLAPHKVSA